MKKIFFSIVFLVVSVVLFSQFYEDFSDGNYTANPTWFGDTAKYKISTSTAIPSSMRPGLQTNNNVTDSTYMATTYNLQLVDSVEWEFWVKLSFNPSSSNYARIYLLSDNSNLKASLHGYFVSIGYKGVDRIHLVRQDGVNKQILITGSSANLNKSTNVLRVKVKWYDDGTWKLFSDTLGGTNYVFEGMAMDLTYTQGNTLGIYNFYTSSNATKFYFDEFYAGPVRVDTVKPQVAQVKALTPLYVQVIFNEPVNTYEATDPSHYLIDQGIGEPLMVEQDAQNPMAFNLTLSSPLVERSFYHITIQQISDLSGNYMDLTTLPLIYYVPRAYDVVINEIMADPTPSVTLPEYEYVELYNTTDLPIPLEGFSLVIGTSKKILPSVTISPHGYLILCHNDAVPLLSLYGPAVGFSSFSITNTGTTISLLSPTASLISTVSFTDEWYGNSLKAQGGWSLEQIDPNNPCGGASNWTASQDPRGGTPGQPNSVMANNPDVRKPTLLRATVENDSLICLWFSESMDSLQLLNPANYSFSHGLSLAGIPDPVFPEYAKVYLPLNRPIGEDTLYYVTVSIEAMDCAGNTLDSTKNKTFFAKAKPIEVGDLVINEILSNPTVNTDDFVEIYNKSNKIVDLRHVILATVSNTSQISSPKYVCPYGYLMLPGQYIAFTKKRQSLLSYYYTPNPDWVLQVDALPSYNNDHGTVVLAMDYGLILDQVTYDVSMHDPLLASTDGVSLERLSPYLPSNDPQNWHSASSTVGYATPAYKNSQSIRDSLSGGDFVLLNNSFSPDNDGYEDVLVMQFNSSKPNLWGTLQIFNISGQKVKELFTQKALGTQETFIWDGRDENNQTVPVGYYVLYFNVFDHTGYTKHYKKVIAVVTKFSK